MQVLEKARQAKLLGSSLEARVLLYVSDKYLRESLQSWNQQPNNADPLRFMFIVSQVYKAKGKFLTAAWRAILSTAACIYLISTRSHDIYILLSKL